MSNKGNFKGKLTKDAEFSVTKGGTQLYKFSLAVPTKKPKMENGQKVVNGQGKPEFETIFVDFAAFGKTAETIVNGSLHPLMAKGAFINVDARFDGVNAYLKQDGTPTGSANYVIESFTDLSLIGVSSNKREDGAAYTPSARQNNQQGSYNNPPQGQGSYNNPPQGQGSYNNPPQGQGSYNTPPQGQGSYNNPPQGQGSYNTPPQGQGSYNNPPQGQGSYNYSPQG